MNLIFSEVEAGWNIVRFPNPHYVVDFQVSWRIWLGGIHNNQVYTWPGQILSHFRWQPRSAASTARYIENNHRENTKTNENTNYQKKNSTDFLYKTVFAEIWIFQLKSSICQFNGTLVGGIFQGWGELRRGSFQRGLNQSTHERFWNINPVWCTPTSKMQFNLMWGGFFL